MTRICNITRKKTIFGNKVSHSNIKNKRRFLPNIHYHKFWITEKNCFIRIKVSKKGIKMIDKLGISYFLNKKFFK